jgi:hypothetical protein
VKKTGGIQAGGDAAQALMDLPDKHSDGALKSHKQEVNVEDDLSDSTGAQGADSSGAGRSGKPRGEQNDDSHASAIDDQIQKALGDAQSLEDTIPLDVTHVIKQPKAQRDPAPGKGAKSDQVAGEKSSDAANDANDPAEPGKSERSSDGPAPMDQPELPAGDVTVSVGSVNPLQAEPGRAARTESRPGNAAATPAAGADVGSSDSAGEGAPVDMAAVATPGPEVAGEPAQAAPPHVSPFAIDLVMSTTASRATLALLATGVAGMDRAPSMPIAIVPALADAPVPGAEAEPPARDTDPVAGMGQEISADPVNEVHPGTPMQSLAATALEVGLDEVVGRVERALDSVVEASSLRRLLPWLAGAGLALAAIDLVRRQKRDREQGRRETVGGDHDADTWLPRSITEKA